MKCPQCNSEMVRTNDPYHYSESGLDNIFLEGIDVFKCRCGEAVAGIPNMPELNGLIGQILIKNKYLLSGNEVRFLRKNIGLTITNLSKQLGVAIATISRWEKGTQTISKPNDRLIRLVYAANKGLPIKDIKHLVEDGFEQIAEKDKHIPRHMIPWPKLHDVCTTPA